MIGVAIGASAVAGVAVGAIIGFFFAASINAQWS